MTDEEVVKAKHPKAVDFIVRRGKNNHHEIWHDCIGGLLGKGKNSALAWADAASRIVGKGDEANVSSDNGS